ncbi:MAG TPA: hypothetical protein PK801_05735 [Aggregatilineales bacterium]|nr:hypothetical protein [Aggregatilineales bacterium]HQA67800.1 hypothetical protein [Aggregatilineales bacterium]HQE18719.1 hypothetical protein [Aggregatilineales bacterium]
MLKRRTQTEAYWVEDFKLEQHDIDYLFNVLLERETPLSADEMALHLFRYRVQQEEEELARKRKPGNIYKPAETYEVGDRLTFPQFDQAQGEVIATRPGNNPDYGDFTVLTVQLETGRTVNVASALTADHVLNEIEEELEEEPADLMSPEELFIEYGGHVADAIAERLSEHDDLVRLAGRWFPRSLLVDVNIGHLNLAEAVLDINGGGPMTTPEIIEQIGMLEGVNPRLAEFSMNYALQEDERFDEVGPAGEVLWYLVRMEPDGVRTTPERLIYDPIDYPREVLTPELQQLELEIEDEHSDIPLRRGSVPRRVTLTLTYPHRVSGTLPLSQKLRRMFPTAYEAPRVRFTIIDAETGEQIPAWVVRPGGYVYGLGDWFEEKGVPTGGYLTVEAMDVGGQVKLSYAGRNPRREWVRTAVVENDRLRFDNRQTTIAAEYDELMLIDVEDPEALDQLWQRIRRQDPPLEDVVIDVARALAAYNPQNNIHAKTLYSAVNLIRRCPPGPIFALLVLSPAFEHVGGPYWRLAGQGAEVEA